MKKLVLSLCLLGTLSHQIIRSDDETVSSLLKKQLINITSLNMAHAVAGRLKNLVYYGSISSPYERFRSSLFNLIDLDGIDLLQKSSRLLERNSYNIFLSLLLRNEDLLKLYEKVYVLVKKKISNEATGKYIAGILTLTLYTGTTIAGTVAYDILTSTLSSVLHQSIYSS